MKIERTDKDFGGGSGSEIYDSGMFRVVVWQLQRGVRTSIECKLCFDLELDFEGSHDFVTDELCMEQVEVCEIIQMIKEQAETSFEEGRESKVAEIRKCLGV